MDMAKASRIGNCSRLNSKGKLEDNMGILGKKTCSPFAEPVGTVASMLCSYSRFTARRVPVLSFGGSMFRNRIVGTPILSWRLCGGIPGGFKEFRNSVG